MTELRDGRYEGSSPDFLVDVRIDTKCTGLISADLFRALPPGHEHVASVRIQPDAVPSASGRWPAVYQAYDGTTAPGELEIGRLDGADDAATVTFTVDRRLDVLPVGVGIPIDVHRTASEPRRLGLEVETEEGVELPKTFAVNGGRVTVAEVLQRAGFQVRAVGRRTVIPRNGDGWRWDESVVYGILDDLMRRTADDGLLLPAWKLHLLQLGRPAKPGVFGVMFDLAAELPRQGCAVFIDEIRDFTPEKRLDQRLLHTLVHEVGHAFNLVHRFENAVGQARSPSVMNYPDVFPDGEDEYWRVCAFGFDPDELSFLRHGPRPAVMPGAAPFHAVDYWGTAPPGGLGRGGPTPGFSLWLKPPANGGIFAYGQPIFLEVGLRNEGSEPVELPPEPLDIKAGHLDILIERAPAFGGRPTGTGASFVPMVRRCLAIATDVTPGPPRLQPGDEIRENVNLAFGGAGFPVADPGEYLLTPVLTLADESLVRGSTLRVWVDEPAGRRAAQQAERLLQPEVAAWFALGGSHVLTGAHDVVQDVLAERDHDRRAWGPADPIAAAIRRSLGIHASRSYLRLADHGFRRHQPDPRYAARMLRPLATGAGARQCFDNATIASTAGLVTRLYEDERRAGQS
jgi:hypothetical protein